ncbi:potassium transporter [Thauera terpenica 58Eu]|jgi:CPA2 family monovalent cation:H+ antiporter-2|uniref:Potassium transporter n=1 Tax=Thauera terpenica 58Eu TaxID=1348657 RepID=S9ZUM1_9RHOO|nr:cation:proton antiporter [Thauera terpenica]EPZ17227.1 potassium transporter [Thauera terpenica 58Eu]
MDAHSPVPLLREIILFLALAGLLIPLLARLRINPVLGFLAFGTLIGPYGLASFAAQWPWLSWLTFARPEDVEFLAELGVIFLMFMIGLDMSMQRLWSMRRLVFGLGGLQVVLTAAAIGLLAARFGNGVEASVILGVVLAFSSTAIIMQLLIQRRELGTPLGQSAFAILLCQDLAVVPLLVLISILGSSTAEGSFAFLLASATLKGVLTVVALYLIGRRVVRPLFHQIAADRQADTFTALTLLTTLGVAALTYSAGLSMALGALLAGLIIAETEFRHEVEITIEPFKGLLMGLFFLSVGMGIDLRALLAQPVWIPLSVVGLFALKGLIVTVLLRVFGLSWGRATEGGLLLGQGGEFAFIVIGLALSFELIARPVGQFMLIVVGVSMLIAPLVARLGQGLGDAIDRRMPPTRLPEDVALGALDGHVIIAGYGRVGQMVGQMLAEQGVRFVAIEHDAKTVALHRKAGVALIFGDASRPELLRKLHIERARAVVLTMDHTAAATHAVQGIRRIEPRMYIIARSRDEKHALLLREAGASIVVPETLESSLKLAGSVLETLGVPPDATARLLEQERERRIMALRD